MQSNPAAYPARCILLPEHQSPRSTACSVVRGL